MFVSQAVELHTAASAVLPLLLSSGTSGLAASSSTHSVFSMIKHLFIDLDDTLWDTYHNNKSSLEELYHTHAWDRYFDSFETFFSIYLPHNEALWSEYRYGQIDKPTLTLERFRRPFTGYLTLSDEQILTWNAEFLSITGRKTRLCPHALEVMEYLHRYYKVYILSNGFREIQHAKLTNSGLAPYIDRVILSEDAGINKPNKKIFDFALVKAKARKTESIMIGDSWEADIVGAANAGLASVWYNPNRHILPDDGVGAPMHIISSLSELMQIF
ncbi:YjjG family noncanonical pyrimidine nucleotidase [Porphyromonas gingivalis]|uniref:YjjG family noncanonical pyrimidine nucleotidase n=1 Tax=Porphyromonas gingivalis TaxID=837 RepID=UPI000974FFA9|nr:YjjG family noncanonical pyrimidine nucleotidase [Porphyromonas gingivalis]SJL23163.1 noncanonical pyrimidine nucleotidase%2C YjjG family [Porphyromonas gingivalis]